MKLIGLSGRKQSGKDTVASMIEELVLGPVAKIAFADALKHEVCKLLGVTREEIEADKARFRGILQWWGTEWRRNENRYYWIEQLDVAVDCARKGGAKLTIITDCRFPNEADYVKSKGGIVVRVDRPTNSQDTHTSETAMDDYAFDGTIYNYGSLGYLKLNVMRFCERLAGDGGLFTQITLPPPEAVVASFMAQVDQENALPG